MTSQIQSDSTRDSSFLLGYKAFYSLDSCFILFLTAQNPECPFFFLYYLITAPTIDPFHNGSELRGTITEGRGTNALVLIIPDVTRKLSPVTSGRPRRSRHADTLDRLQAELRGIYLFIPCPYIIDWPTARCRDTCLNGFVAQSEVGTRGVR